MTVAALIPARGGSKGVPGKNLRKLGGHPLIAYSIQAAHLSSRIDRILLSTDSDEIAAVGLAYGAEVPFRRPAELASDAARDRGFVAHALDWLDRDGGEVEYLVHLRPTTPLRDPVIVDVAIDLLRSRPDATSLRSAHEAPESPFKWFTKSADGLFQGLADERAGWSTAPRQAVPPVFVPDGYVDVLRADYVRTHDDIYGSHMLAFVSPVCREIDTIDDLEYLEYRLTFGHPLLERLNARTRPRV